MSLIIDVHARQILDSRGNPTVEVDVITENVFRNKFLFVYTFHFFFL